MRSNLGSRAELPMTPSRGLNELQRAELASVGRMPGRSPGVTIVDGTVANG